MRVSGNIASIVKKSVTARSRRLLHQTVMRAAVTSFQMPAMSPTMSEGGIASWKKKEGESFAVGDVLLEIETDKATIDVEAQEDGIMGKILVPDGAKNVPVGKVIALLAEEGDDISSLEVPKEEPAAQQTSPAPASPSPTSTKSQESQPSPSVNHHGPSPSHSRPLFPSVYRLALEHGVTNLDTIKGTGVRGMVTKGDILTYLGLASGPNGTYKAPISPIEEANKNRTAVGMKQESKPLDGPTIRRTIVNSMHQSSLRARNPPPDYQNINFDSIIADYIPSKTSFKPPVDSGIPPSKPSKSSLGFLDGLV